MKFAGYRVFILLLAGLSLLAQSEGLSAVYCFAGERIELFNESEVLKLDAGYLPRIFLKEEALERIKSMPIDPKAIFIMKLGDEELFVGGFFHYLNSGRSGSPAILYFKDDSGFHIYSEENFIRLMHDFRDMRFNRRLCHPRLIKYLESKKIPVIGQYAIELMNKLQD